MAYMWRPSERHRMVAGRASLAYYDHRNTGGDAMLQAFGIIALSVWGKHRVYKLNLLQPSGPDNAGF